MLLKTKHHFFEYHFLKVVFLFLVLGFLAYHQTLSYPFVHDDIVFIRHNPHIANLGRMADIFLKPADWGEGIVNANLYYRPLLEVVYRLQYRLFGFNPWGYHLCNVILHVINSVLIFLLLQLLLQRRGLAFCVGVIFLLHPAQTEAVASIVGISNLLFTTFCLVSLLCCFFAEHMSAHKRLTRGALEGFAVVAFLCALFAKEHAIVLPFLVGMIGWRFPHLFGKSFPKRTLIFFLVMIGYFIFRGALGISPHASLFHHGGELWLRINTIPKTLLMYGGILLFPHNLHYYRTLDILDPTIFSTVVFVALLLGGGVLFSSLKKEDRQFLIFGVGWFFIALLPTLNIFPLIIEYSIISTAEHFLYLPLAGFILCVLVIVRHGGQRVKIRQETIIASVVCLCLVLLGSTIQQTRYWRSEIALFERTIRFEKKIGRVYSLLGKAYYFDGNLRKAVESYQKALDIFGGYLAEVKDGRAVKFYAGLVKEVYFDLAHCYVSARMYKKALEQYDQALVLAPEDLQIQNNIGSVYLQQGKVKEAAPYFKKTIDRDSQNVMAMNNLAICYIEEGRLTEAQKLLERALAINPGFHPARQNLERMILQQRGR